MNIKALLSRQKGQPIFPERGLDFYGISYCKQLISELSDASRSLTDFDNSELRAIEEKMLSGKLEWDDLYKLELRLLQVEPDEKVRARIFFLRKIFEKISDSESFAAYLSSGPPDPKKGDAIQVRTDAVYVLTEIQRARIAANALKRISDEMSIRLLKKLGAACALLGFLMAANSLAGGSKWLTMLPVAILAGVLGEFVSALRRIQRIKPRGSAVEQLEDVNRLKASRYFGVPVLGAIGALLAYLAFGAQMLKGGLFPIFDWQGPPPESISFSDFLDNFGPKNGDDYAKTLVWCFLAGFSERFIPDVLDSFVHKSLDRPSHLQKREPLGEARDEDLTS